VDDTEWRTSSSSGSHGANCVEVCGDLDHLRDSKNSNGARLTVSVQELVVWIKLDH
jgi:hypothetical protein